MLLDFLNEQLPWRCCKSSKMDEVRDIKAKCLADPERLLWRTTTSGIQEVRSIFHALQRLEYADRPDYAYVRGQLNALLAKEEAKCFQGLSDTRESVTVVLIVKCRENADPPLLLLSMLPCRIKKLPKKILRLRIA